MPRATDIVHIALILYVSKANPGELAAVIDSIRKQSLMPYFVRIVVGCDIDIRFDPRVIQAMTELQQLCPNVVTMAAEGQTKTEALVMANNSLSDKKFDVLVVTDANVVLPVDTLFHLVAPYLWLPKLLTIDGIVYDDRYPVGSVKKFFVRGLARELITGKFSRDKVGVLSAARKITARDNLGKLQLKLWSDIHRDETAEPKLALYY